MMCYLTTRLQTGAMSARLPLLALTRAADCERSAEGFRGASAGGSLGAGRPRRELGWDLGKEQNMATNRNGNFAEGRVGDRGRERHRPRGSVGVRP